MYNTFWYIVIQNIVVDDVLNPAITFEVSFGQKGSVEDDGLLACETIRLSKTVSLMLPVDLP